jgi:uncharacterized membrane protein
MVFYETLKLLHILFAMIAVGGNLTYGFWIGTASANPPSLPHVLRRVRDFDRYIANPAYGAVLVTGIGMAWLVWGLTNWVLVALILWVVAMGMGTGLFLPTLKRQIEALDRHGFQSEAYQTLAKRGTTMGLLTMVPVFLILVLMVFKPDGWF